MLPRQLAGFPEFRAAMLGVVRRKPALLEWRAREGDDLGLMLVEWWAYVFDIVTFYNQQLAQNAYLRTAVDAGAMRRLTDLIGYRPRPAVAAEALLAALADSGPDRLVPAWTAFRSEAFDNEPPQVYETDTDGTVAWARNRWTLAPIHPTNADGGALLFEARSLRLTRGALMLLDWGSTSLVARVTDVRPVRAIDNVTYSQVTTDPPLAPPSGTPLGGVRVRLATQTAGFNRVSDTVISGNFLLLDGEYPQLAAGQVVVLAPASKSAVVLAIVGVDTPLATPRTTLSASYPARPVTRLEFASGLDASWKAAGSLVHFGLVDAGTLARPARVRVQRADLLPTAPLAGVAEPLESPASGPFLLEDRDQRGLRLDGTANVTGAGVGVLVPGSSTEPFVAPLVPPISVYGNVVHVVRGETVGHEVLGSGVAGVAFPSFKLKKKPLTYVARSGATGGRASTLEIRVNGLRWREVDSFFGTTPDDQVYIVRQNEDRDSLVTFWTLPAGVDNVVARYRFGAGAAKPPAGTLTQAVRPVKGVRMVNPVMPFGGADADRPADIRRNAPTVALTLGRAISLADFEAMARSFGAVNVTAGWAWDGALQRAVAKLWCIADGGDISVKLHAFLADQADPTVPIVVAPAVPISSRLIVDFVTDERADPVIVGAALIAALTDAERGVLAHANVPIGGSLFRSVLLKEALAVPGVTSVNGVTVNGTAMPVALTAGEGRYLDFLPWTNAA